MKQFILAHDSSGWQAEFDIDVAKAAPHCRASLKFFANVIEPEDDSDQAAVEAFLEFWSPCLAQWALELHGSESHIIEHSTKTEGMVPLNGELGIKLIYCDVFEIAREDFVITSETEQEAA